MRTYDLKDEEGRVRAFEVDNIVLGRGGVAAVVGRLPGVRLIRRPRILSWWREEEFCEFEVEGVHFVASEPFGDNSRYWIGPRPPMFVKQTAIVRAAFAAYLSARWLVWVRRLTFGLAASGLILLFLASVETWAFGKQLGLGIFLAGGIPLTLIWLIASRGLLRA